MTAMSDMKTRNNFVWILHRSVCRRWIMFLLLVLLPLFGFSILKRISYNEAKFNWPSSDHRIEIWNFEGIFLNKIKGITSPTFITLALESLLQLIQ